MNKQSTSLKSDSKNTGSNEALYLDKVLDEALRAERNAELRKEVAEEKDFNTVFFPIFLFVSALVIASALIIMSFKAISFYLSQGTWGF